MLADEGKIALARQFLAPVASNPHGGKLAETASDYRDQLESVAEGTRWRPSVAIDIDALAEADEDDEDDDEDEIRLN